MQLATKAGKLLIRDPDTTQAAIIKSWGKFKWSRKNKWWEGAMEQEVLNKLATMVKLPPIIEAERIRMNTVQMLVDQERAKPAEKVAPMVRYPVTKTLYKHQMRAANMALLTFGIIKPEEVSE